MGGSSQTSSDQPSNLILSGLSAQHLVPVREPPKLLDDPQTVGEVVLDDPQWVILAQLGRDVIDPDLSRKFLLLSKIVEQCREVLLT